MQILTSLTAHERRETQVEVFFMPLFDLLTQKRLLLNDQVNEFFLAGTLAVGALHDVRCTYQVPSHVEWMVAVLLILIYNPSLPGTPPKIPLRKVDLLSKRSSSKQSFGQFFRHLHFYIRMGILKGTLKLPPGHLRSDEDILSLKLYLENSPLANCSDFIAFEKIRTEKHTTDTPSIEKEKESLRGSQPPSDDPMSSLSSLFVSIDLNNASNHFEKASGTFKLIGDFVGVSEVPISKSIKGNRQNFAKEDKCVDFPFPRKSIEIILIPSLSQSSGPADFISMINQASLKLKYRCGSDVAFYVAKSPPIGFGPLVFVTFIYKDGTFQQKLSPDEDLESAFDDILPSAPISKQSDSYFSFRLLRKPESTHTIQSIPSWLLPELSDYNCSRRILSDIPSDQKERSEIGSEKYLDPNFLWEKEETETITQFVDGLHRFGIHSEDLVAFTQQPINTKELQLKGFDITILKRMFRQYFFRLRFDG
jgi:hypothetical protein